MQHTRWFMSAFLMVLMFVAASVSAQEQKESSDKAVTPERAEPFTGTLRVRQKGGTLLYRIYVERGRVVGGFSAWGGDEKPFQDIVGGWFDHDHLTILVQSRGHNIHDRWYTHMHQFERDAENPESIRIVHSLFDFGKDMSTKIVFQPHMIDEIKELPPEEVAERAAKARQTAPPQQDLQRMRAEHAAALAGAKAENARLVAQLAQKRKFTEDILRQKAQEAAQQSAELRNTAREAQQHARRAEQLKEENAQLKQLIAEMLLEQRRKKPNPAEHDEAHARADGSRRPPAVLPLELPYPVFGPGGGPSAIPKDIRVDPARTGKRRPPLLVPRGVRNLALGRPVTSSDPAPLEGRLDMITNGQKDALDGRYVELAVGPQWVQIDLGQSSEVVAVAVWHLFYDRYVYRDVVVQLSDDPQFKHGVITVFNNDHDNTLGFGKGLDYEYFESDEGLLVNCMDDAVQGKAARYVRCWSNEHAGADDRDPTNCYLEVEVWGLPQTPPEQ